MFLDAPRGLRDSARIVERKAMLAEPSIAPLHAWAESLGARKGAVVPFFDPADAGIDARVLLLLEAAGPMTNAENERPGSGFISCDNDDQTEENLWTVRNEVGLHGGVLQWNIVPWCLGVASVKPSVSELGQGAMELRRLLSLLGLLQLRLTR